MNLTNHFQINKPDVILENFGDEVVIVNLSNGNYYSVDSIGAEVWALIENGSMAGQVVETMGRLYEAAPADIENATAHFIDELISENLIVVVNREGLSAGAADGEPPTAKRPFVPPILNKYTDMQELLLIDPIHDVDDTGWPNIELPTKDSTPE